MSGAIAPGRLAELAAPLAAARRRVAARLPGEPEGRQPVHTVYGGAHLFRHDTAPRLGELARRALGAWAPDADRFVAALTPPGGAPLLPPELAAPVWGRMVAKLGREPVEDFRIDFEDGYGHRPDAEEDGHAASAAREVARGLAGGTLPPFVGLRIKPFTEELRGRSVRTLDLFLGALVEATGGRLPPGFIVTLPKVTLPEEPALLARLLAELEERLGLAPRALGFEIMVETPQSVLAPDGTVALPALVEAGDGRITGAHFGTYDYTASLAITAAHQHMAHPVCDFAKRVMQVALAGRGVWLSDGATNVLPVAPHRRGPGGGEPTAEQAAANRAAVHGAWRLHFGHVRKSLVEGFYQGWDLHPAQLPTRYAAVFAFFLEGLDPASARLANFLDQAARATLAGDVFDDAATGQGLLNYFLRAIQSGAVDEAEVRRRTGLTPGELATRSFPAILAHRRAGSGDD